MDDTKEITLTVSEYIERVSKELNIQDTKGLYGNDLELIALVRNCQFLYDRGVSDFKDKQKKSEAWEAIGAVFGVSSNDVQLRWKNIRDVFSKCKNRSEGPTAARNLSCPHYDELRFLEPFIITRNRVSLNRSIKETVTSEEDCSLRERQILVNLEDIRLFIDRIKQTPIVYHQKFKGQSNQAEKLDAWQHISHTFGIPLNECLNRWKNLRERYSRERRLSKQENTASKWELYGDLCFLDQHVKPRKRSYIRDWKTIQEKTPNLCYVLTSDQSQTETVVLNPMYSKTRKAKLEDVEFLDVSNDLTSSPTHEFHEEVEEEELDPEDADMEKGKLEMDHEQVGGLDEDDLFGKTIAAELKRLSCPKKKMKLKAAMYNLLYEYS